MEDRISKNFIEIGKSQGIGILELAEIAAGDSLLPGEEKKNSKLWPNKLEG